MIGLKCFSLSDSIPELLTLPLSESKTPPKNPPKLVLLGTPEPPPLSPRKDGVHPEPPPRSIEDGIVDEGSLSPALAFRPPPNPTGVLIPKQTFLSSTLKIDGRPARGLTKGTIIRFSNPTSDLGKPWSKQPPPPLPSLSTKSSDCLSSIRATGSPPDSRPSLALG